MTKRVLLVPNANSENGSKALVSSDGQSALTFGGVVDDKCKKGQVWKDYISHILGFLYPSAQDKDAVPKIYFGSENVSDKGVWIKYTQFKGPLEFNDDHELLNRLVILYQGLDAEHLTRGNTEKMANIEAMLRKTPDRYKHSSMLLDWKEVASNGLFDLELSTKRMISLMGIYLEEEKYSLAVSIMNVLGLKFDEVKTTEILPDDPKIA